MINFCPGVIVDFLFNAVIIKKSFNFRDINYQTWFLSLAFFIYFLMQFSNIGFLIVANRYSGKKDSLYGKYY